MTEREKRQGVEETVAAWEPASKVAARPRGPEFSVVEAARETMRRFPKTMARLAE